jgi:hypothetical protein
MKPKALRQGGAMAKKTKPPAPRLPADTLEEVRARLTSLVSGGAKPSAQLAMTMARALPLVLRDDPDPTWDRHQPSC